MSLPHSYKLTLLSDEASKCGKPLMGYDDDDDDDD